MSASMPSLPGPAAPVAAASLAMNGAGESSASSVTASATETPADGHGAGGFAALFQQLLGKQALPDVDSTLLTLPTETTGENGTPAATEDLDALLPFLEAMGLTNTAKSSVADDEESPSAVESTADAATDALAAITPEITVAPAISAAKSEASSTNSSAELANLTASKGEISTNTNAQSAFNNAAQAKDAAAGNEFAKQLVAAIEGNKEAGQTPGSVANAVQQVMSQATPRNPPHAATPTLPVATAVGSDGWNQEVGNRIVWMANRQESRADLILNPPQMGRVEVSLSVSGDQATANFVSGNPAVREALEAALPRLREVLAEAGIQLGQSQVGAETAQQSSRDEKNQDNFAFGRDAQAEDSRLQAASGPVPAAGGLKMGRGLVDVFA